MRTALLVALGTLAATEVLAQAPGSVVRSGRELQQPSVGQASRAVRAQAQRPDRRSALNARAEQRTVAPAAFNGSWSVAINTRSGGCEPHLRFAVQITNGSVFYEGRPAGRVSPNGAVRVNISSGGQQASGQGRLSHNYGNGAWRGSGSAGNCAGTWQAGRNG